MGYLCNAESAIATCDSYNFDKSLSLLSNNNNNNKRHRKSNSSTTTTHTPFHDLRLFSYSQIESATNSFSPLSLLGKGSHGSVFLATLDSGSLLAAVKRSSIPSSFLHNEIHILSHIRSPCIVNLIGYSHNNNYNNNINNIDYTQPLQLNPSAVHKTLNNNNNNNIDINNNSSFLLVVEYMPNGSLYDLLHKNPKPPAWSNRVRFALQVSKAVQSLHSSNPPVIHRDIKSSNILIDVKKNARLSDFGLALRGHVDDMRVLSTPPAGTLGYLDPCYLAPGDVSFKSDVFSFGILLLEIISGRRAIDVNYSPHAIIEWALPLIKSGSYQGVCDRRIRCPSDPTVIEEMVILAARCVRSTAAKRPSMKEVVDCLQRVYRRVKATCIWNINLRRRLRHVEKSWPLDVGFDASDDVEEQVKNPRHGSRRSLSRKVVVTKQSTVEDHDDDQISNEMIVEVLTRGRHRVGRSKSIGSFREIKVGPDEIGVKKRAQVTVKMSTVRLSKSRSMSVLHGKNNNKEMQGVKNGQIKELDVFPLLLNFSTKSKTQKSEVEVMS